MNHTDCIHRSKKFDSLKCLLIDMAGARCPRSLLRMAVERIREIEDVALVRAWLIEPGDICDSCLMAKECPDRSKCLHLVASASNPLDPTEGEAGQEALDRLYRRLPIGVRKIGQVAASGEAIEISDAQETPRSFADPDWIRDEEIEGLVAQPFVYRDELLGVLAVFLRGPVVEDASLWLRMVADHAASAIANARAFQEIESLRAQLSNENEYLRDEVRQLNAGDMIGHSPALTKVLEQVELVAPTDSNVLILGESGTGKELVARAIHEQSERRDGPLIKVNCASVPDDLFESEFFGHVKGAFTSALRDRVGRFELADGGTLFLDEVGEIPLEMQSKLLRVIQEGTFERVGDEVTRTVDVRIIAATNRDLESEVRAGRFRQDLYYRLGVFPVEVAPLRDRREDIPTLVIHFLEASVRRIGVESPRLKRRHLVELQEYDWPGNVRELQNVVERAVIRARTGALEFDLPRQPSASSGDQKSAAPAARQAPEKGKLFTYDELKQLEKDNVAAVLESVDWKISGEGGAAEFLGVHPATLSSRMKAMGIERVQREA